MFRLFGRLIFLSALTALAILGWRVYLQYAGRDLQLQAMQQKNDELQRVVDRLNVSHRVARVMVLDQKPDAAGQLQTTLLWTESDAAGSPSSRQFTVAGDEVHFDAMVIQFDHGYVEQADALRGHSIALFTRAYGDSQPPNQGFRLDAPNQTPAAYRDSTLEQGAFEQTLWHDFWRLYDDADYRQQMGVRLAEGQGVWGKFTTGQVYSISVEANGGVDLSHEPADPMYLDAIRKSAGLSSAAE